MRESSNQWASHFARLGALWIHDGNPENPHALLTSGMHSAGFFNATEVVKEPCVTQCACQELSRRIITELAKNDLPEKSPQVVIGSAFGAITIAHECAKFLSARMAFTEKADGKMSLKRFFVTDGERALVVEDVITTGTTTQKTIAELEQRGAYVLPVIAAFTNRSGKDTLNGKKIVSLIEHPMPTWTPAECPLCKDGSKVLRPKVHWDELSGRR